MRPVSPQKEAAVRVPALYTDAISTALLIPVTCHRSQALISRMNATNKAAIFSKVIGTLQNVKKVLELVTKLAMSSHSVALKVSSALHKEFICVGCSSALALFSWHILRQAYVFPAYLFAISF